MSASRSCYRTATTTMELFRSFDNNGPIWHQVKVCLCDDVMFKVYTCLYQFCSQLPAVFPLHTPRKHPQTISDVHPYTRNKQTNLGQPVSSLSSLSFVYSTIHQSYTYVFWWEFFQLKCMSNYSFLWYFGFSMQR